ncbi:uncharacterized protein LOC142326687 [Lycorma delicatula]|uniref:uncharacterized protein LOC142326687 n=1 Tax=Lycorma delicatula TaxID=130591 RepID=UPI003F515443
MKIGLFCSKMSTNHIKNDIILSIGRRIVQLVQINSLYDEFEGCVEQNVVAETEFSSSDTDDKDMDKDYIPDEPTNSSSDEGSNLPTTQTTEARNSAFYEGRNSTTQSSEITPLKEGGKGELSRKRKCNCSEWNKNVAKIRRNSGKRYVSASGKEISEITLHPPCNTKCRLSCSDKISHLQRQE